MKPRCAKAAAGRLFAVSRSWQCVTCCVPLSSTRVVAETIMRALQSGIEGQPCRSIAVSQRPQVAADRAQTTVEDPKGEVLGG
jgi:actin-like ATPase involved in cell morphogenesis